MTRTLPPLLLLATACGPKEPPAPPAPEWGWIEGAEGACWVPQPFDNPTPEDLAAGRRETVDNLALQWRGGRNDGVDFGDGLAKEVRDLLRQKPDRVDAVAATNLEYCLEWAAGGVATMAWGGWLESLPAELTAGDCIALLEEPWFDTLSVDRGWQHELALCPGEEVELSATARAGFSLGPDGPSSTVAGLADTPPPEGSLCTDDGCLWGMLLGRFETLDGQVSVFPIGTGTVFTAPDEGQLSFAVNDSDHRDNAYTIVDGVQDGANLGVRPTR